MLVFILSKVIHEGIEVNSLIGAHKEFHSCMRFLGATKATKVSEAQWMVAVGDDVYTITSMDVQNYVANI